MVYHYMVRWYATTGYYGIPLHGTMVYQYMVPWYTCDKLCCFQRLSVLYTKEPFQTADGKMAESRMGDEEACLDLKLEKMI